MLSKSTHKKIYCTLKDDKSKKTGEKAKDGRTQKLPKSPRPLSNLRKKIWHKMEKSKKERKRGR